MWFIILSFFLFCIGVFIAIKVFPNILDIALIKSQNKGQFKGPWKTKLSVGRPILKKIEKAAIARVGLGANSSDETVYWNAFRDSSGQILNSKYDYRIIIRENIGIKYAERGFWSITVYGQDQFLVKNSNKKYMIRREQEIEKKDLPLIVELGKSNNGSFENIPLPKTEEHFTLALRCYRPKIEMKDESSWQFITLPEIVRI